MKKRTATLIVLFIALCAVFIWQYASFMLLRGELEHQVAAIAEGYATIVREDVEPLQRTHTLNTAQSRLFTQMQKTATLLADNHLSVEERIQAISNIQRELARFSTAAADSPDIVADPVFAHIQTQIGEHGEIRTLLSQYNDIAAKWNHGIQSELGSVLGRIDRTGRSILPYLRFDGEQEFVPVISL